MSLLEFWRGKEERAALLKRASQLRLHPSQLKQLLGDNAVRTELHEARMVSLLPPVGTEVFRRLSPASLEEIQQKEQRKNKNNGVEVKYQPKPAIHLEGCKPLPFIYGDAPPELLNTPLEELDPFYQSQKTFIVLGRGNIIHRFNAEPACSLLSPFNPVRTAAIRILIHSWFHLFILMTLLINSVFMMISNPPEWSKIAEYVFTSIYMFEIIVKIASRGFCAGRFTFLRDPWNWLDVMVIGMAFLSEFVELGKVSVLRTVPLAMKMISVYPDAKTTASAVIKSVKRLVDVVVLMVLVLSVLAAVGLHLFMGTLRQKCVVWPLNFTEIYLDNGTLDKFDYNEHITNHANFYYVPGHLDPLLCGNTSTAGACPEGYSCLRGGANPNYGYTNYDSFGWSLLALFRLMTIDFWENLFQIMMRADGRPSVILFMLFVLPSSFCLLSLFFTVVAVAFVEQHKARIMEAKRREEEFIQILDVMKKRKQEEQTACREELSEKQDPTPQDKSSAAVIWSDEQKQSAVGDSKQDQKLCLPCCCAFLKWNCCGCWRWLKQWLCAIITNPFFDFGIVCCLILNSLFMAMEHYPLTPKMDEFLVTANLVFIGIFTVEMLLRLVAMDPYGYFQVRWHIYDSIVVVVSLLELGLQDIEGLSALHCFRLARMLRLARWWPSLHMFMKSIWISVGPLKNLTFILLITVFIFAASGTQLFKEDYTKCVCRITADCELPRWNMTDFFHSFMMIFKILCGEWIETIWDCMEVSGQGICLVFYMTVLFIGNLLLVSHGGGHTTEALNVFIVFLQALNFFLVIVQILNVSLSLFELLNLFLALLLTPVSGDNLKEKGENNLHISMNWIKGCVTWICTLLGKKTPVSQDHKVADSKKDKKEYLSMTHVTSEELVKVEVKPPRDNSAKAEIGVKMHENEDKEEEKQKQDEDIHHSQNTPENCCCDSCYHCCPFLDVDSSKGIRRVWSNFRTACFSIVKHRHFENFIIFIILLSSAVLVFEDIYLQHHQVLQMVLDRADQVFTYLFLLEMVLKWMAFGFKKYFTSASCWLDFLILAVSLMSSVAGMLGFSELKTVRALRPLRALSRFQGPRVVLRALVVTLPYMIDILLVVMFIWLIFSITGVNLFAGKFAYCYNETSEEYFLPEMVSNKSDCLTLIEWGYDEIRWKSLKINFDSVGASYLALLQVATFKGWYDIMYSAVDTTQVESQPEYEYNVYMYLYFVCFVIIGRFFTFNFFIRTVINALDQQRHKLGGKHMFMTDQQQKYSRAIKKLFSKKHQPGPRPQNKCQALLFDLVTKQPFEVFMKVMICLNVVTLMVETYDDSLMKVEIVHWLIFVFNVIFLTEFILKIIALRKHYFSDCLNIIDFVVIFFSIVGMFLYDLMEKYFVSPQLLSVFRLGRICPLARITHLIYCGRRIRKLLLAFMMSLPALFNICLLIFILMFTYSIFGMFNFAYVKQGAGLNDMTNFETFVNSMICMFTITTTAGWDGLLYPILNTPPDCDPYLENPGSNVTGNCSSPTVGIIFFTSYVVLSLLLVAHLYIAVILETFSSDDTEHLDDDDLQMFYKTWVKFDPEGSQVIQYSQLSDFCDRLQDPLRIPKPNNIKLINMDLPLLPEDKVYCVDVLLALTAQVCGESGERDILKARMEEKFTTKNTKVTYEPISSTLQRKQKEMAATVIQRAYRKHHLQDRDAQGMAAERAAVAIVDSGV